jgi:hypothetical protein
MSILLSSSSLIVIPPEFRPWFHPLHFNIKLLSGMYGVQLEENIPTGILTTFHFFHPPGAL